MCNSWVVIWERGLELFLTILNWSKVAQPDALKQNGMADSKMEMYKWKYV